MSAVERKMAASKQLAVQLIHIFLIINTLELSQSLKYEYQTPFSRLGRNLTE